MYIFNAHTNMIHTWLMPAQYSMDIMLTFIPCWGIQKVFSAFQLFNNLFSNSIMHHCVWRVTTLASFVQKIFKNKYQLFTSEAGSNLIFFSTPNQGKVGQSNSKQSKKGARPFQQQVNTPRVYSILILLCVFVHLCVFDVYARCCVYFLLSVCFLFVYIMLCLFMHFVCFLFCVCTAAFCPCMPFTQLRGFPKHPRLPLIPNSTFSNFRSNGPVLVIPRLSIRSTDFSYLLKCSPRWSVFCDIPLKGRNYNAWKSSEDHSIISSVYILTVIQ